MKLFTPDGYSMIMKGLQIGALAVAFIIIVGFSCKNLLHAHVDFIDTTVTIELIHMDHMEKNQNPYRDWDRDLEQQNNNGNHSQEIEPNTDHE